METNIQTHKEENKFIQLCPLFFSLFGKHRHLKYSLIKLYLSVPSWLIIDELLSAVNTQLFIKSNMYIYYSNINIRLVSKSWFHR
jgi:hypothetical protein